MPPVRNPKRMSPSKKMNDFSKRWDEISHLGFDAGRLRVMPDHPLDLFIAYSPQGHRQFMFQIPELEDGILEPPRLENLTADILEMDGRSTLVLTLGEAELRDLFSVMCVDLADASSDAAGPESAASIFMTRLDRWADLLRRRRGGGMTLPERLGLLGELILIEDLLAKRAIPPGPLVHGWRGPRGDATDIAAHGLRFEVKAQLATAAPRLRISSLDQLDGSDDSLIVVWHRFSRADHAKSLGMLVDSIANHLSPAHRDVLEFQRKLLLSGYDPDADYVDESFSLDRRIAYRVSEKFPKLVRRDVPDGIVEAQYDISCGHLAEFEIPHVEFEELFHG